MHVHGLDGPAGRGRSDRVNIFPDFGESGQHFGFFSFSLIIFRYLNRYESSNTFGLILFFTIFNLIQ
jgi:hypothetical protein